MSGTQPSAHHEALVAACRALHEASEPIPLGTLAAGAGLSGSRFQRLFRERFGVTPRQYASHLQRERAQVALGRAPRITDALFDAGFDSPSRFYARAREMLGMTPSAWRDGGPGVSISHAVVDTALGPLLVAATDEGVCRVAFGGRLEGGGVSGGSAARASDAGGGRACARPACESDEPAADDVAGRLVDELVTRFPRATFDAGDARFRDTVAAVAGLLSEASAARRAQAPIPLDIEGTLFQSQVWRVLRGIPAGRTMSYAEVAAALGRPNAHRAVANACAANPVALLIPCHRVVRGNGALGGYRWGIERKRALLEGERVA